MKKDLFSKKDILKFFVKNVDDCEFDYYTLEDAIEVVFTDNFTQYLQDLDDQQLEKAIADPYKAMRCAKEEVLKIYDKDIKSGYAMLCQVINSRRTLVDYYALYLAKAYIGQVFDLKMELSDKNLEEVKSKLQELIEK